MKNRRQPGSETNVGVDTWWRRIQRRARIDWKLRAAARALQVGASVGVLETLQDKVVSLFEATLAEVVKRLLWPTCQLLKAADEKTGSKLVQKVRLTCLDLTFELSIFLVARGERLLKASLPLDSVDQRNGDGREPV